VKVVLTALKCDLRKDEEMNDNLNTITFDQGLAKAKEIGAVKYLGKWSAIYRTHCAFQS
jgi:Rho family protein